MDSSYGRTVVIGAGPAGLMAAITAAGRGCKVILLEKNRFPGKKLSITGKGRCNITNTAEMDQLIDSIPGNGRFLHSTFSQFSNLDLITFIQEEVGIPTVVERGGRVFPASNDAKAVTSALVSLAKKRGVEMILNAEAASVNVDNGAVVSVSLKSGREIACSSAIIATGGTAYGGTGSTGDGYRMAASLGHTIIPPEPSLVPLVSSAHWVGSLSGLALKNISVVLLDEKKRQLYKDFGEMLFTHNGVSGPVILSASRHMAGRAGGETTLCVDLKPALTEDVLDKRILRDFDKNPNKVFKNTLDDLLPKSLIPVIVELSGIDPAKPVNQIIKSERQSLVNLLKNLIIPISGTSGMNEAIVTAGGVRTSEINPATMESKLVRGLFFAGEIIDVDGYTGGFNLTIAFCTGHCAGSSVTDATCSRVSHAPTKAV